MPYTLSNSLYAISVQIDKREKGAFSSFFGGGTSGRFMGFHSSGAGSGLRRRRKKGRGRKEVDQRHECLLLKFRGPI